MDDLISRQAAIDALKEHRALFCDNTPDAFSKLSYAEKSRVDELDMAIATLINLPSAQPEIVRCKDCKYWMPHSQLGFDEDNGTYHDYCERLIPEDEYYAFYRDADDYCSRAERRTDEGD